VQHITFCVAALALALWHSLAKTKTISLWILAQVSTS
jgi:hypothetical protein